MPKPLKILGVIPARLDSKRLPGKVLRNIADKPMLYWVYHKVHLSRLLSDVMVATDSEQIRQFCTGESIPVMMTGQHQSGTDRLNEVMERTGADIYVNIQGDEPTLRPEHLELLLRPFLNGNALVSTLKVAVDDVAAQDPNIVKVVTDERGRALYFSRYPIPFDRDCTGEVRRYKHIGLYAYTREALAMFHAMPPSSLESAEKLEQLRFLQKGIPIIVVETQFDTIGVDTEADLQRVTELFAAGNNV